ncbi:hypothetical protein ACGFYU_37170 [Streptomyces sp. NPDC048337]|uniref:hypothetical protein n=1 Tax=Streptomyces sp. NPDC048337 TaxID=3365535 RepID=UPI00370F94CE
MDYDVWTYPVYRKARQGKPDGSMAAVFPTTPSPVQTITPASTEDMGYRPGSQSGVLLSYVGLQS